MVTEEERQERDLSRTASEPDIQMLGDHEVRSQSTRRSFPSCLNSRLYPAVSCVVLCRTHVGECCCATRACSSLGRWYFRAWLENGEPPRHKDTCGFRMFEEVQCRMLEKV